MSESPGPEIDPDSPQPMGDVKRFARRRVGPAKIALAVLLAVLITAAAAVILSVVLWAATSLIH
ncbi:MAG TPA: hypothetical protein VHX64_05970 [Caulobacteraceae bacterium]|nr:hypothetical protein [Caulobacteraceae bacterium]